VPEGFRTVTATPDQHEDILAQLQRLRGRVYLHDGAIEPWQLSADGRHAQEIDRWSWHLVSIQEDGRVTGCARYRVHGARVKPEDLGVWESALARHPSWQETLHQAVSGEIDLARRRNLVYVEVGGWAIAEDRRFTPEALDVALCTWALARSLGGCVGITTATTRNRSSSILRKIGGQPLPLGGATGTTLPSYYDPHYRCEMELLRFDSGTLNPRFEPRIDQLLRRFLEHPVVCAQDTRRPSAARPRHSRNGLPFTMNLLPAVASTGALAAGTSTGSLHAVN
jgi:hypothetical protein